MRYEAVFTFPKRFKKLPNVSIIRVSLKLRDLQFGTGL